jgi:hypothetical protein
MECILAHFSDERVQIGLFDIATLYGSALEARNAVEANFEEVQAEWNRIPLADREKRMLSASRNLVRQGVDDLTNLSESDLNGRILRSAMLCEALDRLGERRKFNKYSSRIQLVEVRGPGHAIHVASCDTSSCHFGVADGVVELRGDRALQRMITSPAQLNEPGVDVGVFDSSAESHGYVGLRRGVVAVRR